MNFERFIPGRVYKDTTGQEFLFIGFDPQTGHAVFRMDGGGGYDCWRADGTPLDSAWDAILSDTSSEVKRCPQFVPDDSGNATLNDVRGYIKS